MGYSVKVGGFEVTCETPEEATRLVQQLQQAETAKPPAKPASQASSVGNGHVPMLGTPRKRVRPVSSKARKLVFDTIKLLHERRSVPVEELAAHLRLKGPRALGNIAGQLSRYLPADVDSKNVIQAGRHGRVRVWMAGSALDEAFKRLNEER